MYGVVMLKPRPDQVNRRERLGLGEGCGWVIALFLAALVGGSAGFFLFHNKFYDAKGDFDAEMAARYSLLGAAILAGITVLAFFLETLIRKFTGHPRKTSSKEEEKPRPSV